MAWDFELVAGPYGDRTDGAVWDGSGLIFSSNGENAIRRYDPSTRTLAVFRPHWMRVCGLALGPDGTLFGCQSGSRRIVRFNADGSASPLRARLDGQLHNCPHHLALDHLGRIWFTDPYDPVPPRGPDIRPFLHHQSVLRLERADGDAWRLQRMTFDSRCPRGIALSSDERTLYVADNDESLDAAHELRAYPIHEDGALGPGRLFHPLANDYAGVDGLALDTAGNVLVCVVAHGQAGVVEVVSWSGNLVETHPLPEGQPTSCAVAEGGRAVYVTTAEGQLFRSTV